MSASAKFKCGSCSRTYAWKQELAGKKVRCKCGGVVQVPQSVATPEAESPELDDLFALAGDSPATKAHAAQRVASGAGSRCPECQGDIDAGAVICVNCGFNLKTGQHMHTETAAPALAVARPALAGAGATAGAIPRAGGRTLGYAGRKPAEVSKEEANAKEEFKALIPPIVLAVLGIISMFYFALFPLQLSFGVAIIQVGVSLIINLVLITLGCLAAMKMLDFSLGAPLAALLKLSAVAMLPGTVCNIIEFYGGIMGGFVGWGVSLLMYWALLMWFFDLDGFEVYLVTTIVWVIRTFLGVIIVGLLVKSAMSGSGGGGGGGGGGSGGGVMSAIFGGDDVVQDDTPAGQTNRQALHLLNRAGATEAKEWAAASPNHVIIDMDHDKTVKTIQDFYDAGAEEVIISDITTFGVKVQADKAIVELPADPAKRKKIIATQAPLFERMKIGVPEDHGKEQDYIIFSFDAMEF